MNNQLFNENTNTKEQLEVLERYYSSEKPRLSDEQIILAIIDLNKARIKAHYASLQFPCMSADGTKKITFATVRSMSQIYHDYTRKVEDLERIGTQNNDFIDAVTSLRNEHKQLKQASQAKWDEVKWDYYPESTKQEKINRMHSEAIKMDKKMQADAIYAEALKNVPQKYIDAIKANA